MGVIRRTAWAGLVWVTAATTLVAGAPHVDCRCPDGHVKPFCLGLPWSPNASTPCCCSGQCCCQARGESPAGRTRGSSCCCGCQAGRHADSSAQGGRSLRGCSCQRTLVASSVVSPVPGKAAGDDSTSAAPLPARPAPIYSGPDLSRGPAYGFPPSLPPPTDLNLLLQRFVI